MAGCRIGSRLATNVENNMRTILILTIAAVFAFSPGLSAQTWRPPPESERCPSKWGAADQRGSGNHMKPETVFRAAKLIRTGRWSSWAAC